LETIFYQPGALLLTDLFEETFQIDKRLPADVGLRCRLHLRAQDSIEHPYRDLAARVLAIIAELAPVHAAAASHLADDDNVLAVERVPPVVHPTNIRPVVTVIGTCTTSADPTRRSPPTGRPTRRMTSSGLLGDRGCAPPPRSPREKKPPES
jgi:hypothetical protein